MTMDRIIGLNRLTPGICLSANALAAMRAVRAMPGRVSGKDKAGLAVVMMGLAEKDLPLDGGLRSINQTHNCSHIVRLNRLDPHSGLISTKDIDCMN